MKVAALAALSVLIALPADAGQRQRQNGSPANACDNNGNCTALNVTTPIPNYRKHRSETQNTIATAQHQSRALDANGNTAGVVISLKTGAHARVGIA
jgi:hypothetical protein